MEILTKNRNRSAASHSEAAAGRKEPCAPLLLVIEETQALSRAVGYLCEYLGVQIEAVGVQQDLRNLLAARGPVAVMAPADAPDQDGCHVLEAVAEYDRDLPVMLVVGRDSTRLSGIETVEAMLRLNAVQKMTTIPGIGDLTEFFLKAGKHRARKPHA